MLNAVLFAAPYVYRAALASGKLVRTGALLRSAETGRIVAHLQETGLAQAAMGFASGLGGPLTLAVEVGNLGNSYLTQQKLNLVTRKLDLVVGMMEELKSFGVATLGVSAAGVGVSVLGFSMLHRRLKDVDQRMDGLHEEVRQFRYEVSDAFHKLFRVQFREHASRVSALVKNAGLARNAPESTQEFRNIADQLSYEAAYFAESIADLTQGGARSELADFRFLVDNLLLVNSARLDCLMLAGESGRALNIAVDVADTYRRLFDPVTVYQLTQADLETATHTIRCLRDITDTALTKPHLLEHLTASDIDYPYFLSSLESEQTQHIVALEAG